MFLVQTKSAALVAALACAAVLAQPGRASAQSDRPPGLKGYALVQWMDEHRTRSSPAAGVRQSMTFAAARSHAYPQPLANAPPRAFAPAATAGVRGRPGVWSCGRR